MIGSKSVISYDTVMQPDAAYMGSPALVVGNRFLSAKDTGRMVYNVRNYASEASACAEDTEDTVEDELQDLKATQYWLYTIQSLLVVVLFDIVAALMYGSVVHMLQISYARLGWQGVLLLPLIAIGGLMMTMVMLWLIKLFLVGQSYRGQAALYSWKFTSQRYMGMVQGILFSFILWMIEGTQFMNMCLRLLGAKVGTRVWFDTNPPVELDLLEIGDNSIVDNHVLIVPHVMDYGRMQFSRIVIGRNCVISMDCLLMPGTAINDGVELLPGTVSSKDEGFPPYTRYQGNCAEFVSLRQPEVIQDQHMTGCEADEFCGKFRCSDLWSSKGFPWFASVTDECETVSETRSLLSEESNLKLKYIV